MKLIIQIPCFNEEDSLPVTLASLPRKIEGIDSLEWLIVDDGSSDNTSIVAKECGVHHVIRHSRNMGLAKTFKTGLKACLELGADIIVNTDADNQYCSSCIPELIKPIIEKRAEMVIGSRPIVSVEEFSKVKKILQKIGSWVVRIASNTDIPDAPSGFRAITRDCAMRLNIFNNYTYTLETIIQAGQKQIPVTSVPVKVNSKLRESRLFKSIPSYVWRSLITITRIFVVYKPFRFFTFFGTIMFFFGVLGNIRFLYFFFNGQGDGHNQSLIMSAMFIFIGVSLFATALIADLQSVNRTILEEIRYKLLKQELDKTVD